jgi:methionine-rich copper-binding protein CopC
MRRRRVLLAGLLLLISSAGLAHTHLISSAPAAGSRLAAAPALLELAFSEAAQLTILTLTRGSDEPLKLPAPTEAQTHIRVPLPSLAPGNYVVRFRALSADGHLMPGQFAFTIAP